MAGTVTFDFAGARVLVTGGTSGIGHAVATSFAGGGRRRDDHRHPLGARRLRHRPRRLPRTTASTWPTRLGRRPVAGRGTRRPRAPSTCWSTTPAPTCPAASTSGHRRLRRRRRAQPRRPQRLTTGLRRALFASEHPGGASVVNLASMTAFRSTDIVPAAARPRPPSSPHRQPGPALGGPGRGSTPSPLASSTRR